MPNDDASCAALAEARTYISRQFEQLHVAAPPAQLQNGDQSQLFSIPDDVYSRLSRTHRRRVSKSLGRMHTELASIRMRKMALMQKATRLSNANSDVYVARQQRELAAARRHAKASATQASSDIAQTVSFEAPRRPVNKKHSALTTDSQMSLVQQIQRIRRQNGLTQDASDDDEPKAIWLI